MPIRLPQDPDFLASAAGVFNQTRRAARTVPSDTPLASPFVVAVDTREQAPYRFEGLRADANKRYRPLVIQTERVCLQQGDYSIRGHEGGIAIERKSLQDLYGTFSQGRERFERELNRLAGEHRYSCVLVEAEWSDILERPPEFRALLPKTVLRSVLAWQQRYPAVHWLCMPGRAAAEDVCYRVLERWWLERVREPLSREPPS